MNAREKITEEEWLPKILPTTFFKNQTATARTFTSGVFVNADSLLKGCSFLVQKGLPRTLPGRVTVLFSLVCHGIIAKAH